MICAYDRIYLEKARIVLARMLDYAVNDLEYTLEDFFELFLRTGMARRFEQGDFTVLVGKSGVEVVYDVLFICKGEIPDVRPRYSVGRSEEYWVGWALAYYQWERAITFEEITRSVPLYYVQRLYAPYHEMDIRHFVEKMDELYKDAKPHTNLKQRRIQAGFSQKELADATGIPLRTIQQYEQRQKNINKAQVEYLVQLSKTLCCTVDSLIEKV